MSERPIIFSGESVRAIQADRKTMTRRVAKLPEKWHRGYTAFQNNPNGAEEFVIFGDCGTKTIYCPYGSVGDLLWVRETICTICYPYQDGKYGFGEYLISYLADDKIIKCPDKYKEWWLHNWRVRAHRLMPAIFMPKWAARIWLEVTAVRVERLQEITDEDVWAEGVICRCNTGESEFDKCCLTPQEHYANLWDSLNAKRKGWNTNPEVWVISFKKANR